MCILLGGAGGKGTWGKLTDVYYEDGKTRDFKDPNYDIEEDVSEVVYDLIISYCLHAMSMCSWHPIAEAHVPRGIL